MQPHVHVQRVVVKSCGCRPAGRPLSRPVTRVCCQRQSEQGSFDELSRSLGVLAPLGRCEGLVRVDVSGMLGSVGESPAVLGASALWVLAPV